MIVAQISSLKLAWTIAALVGVGVTFALLFMSITDFRLLGKRGLNGWRKHIGKTSILIFLGGFMTQVIYLVAGIVSLTQPNLHSSSIAAKHATQTMFLIGSIGAIFLAIIIFYRRLHIISIIEDAMKNKNKEDEH